MKDTDGWVDAYTALKLFEGVIQDRAAAKRSLAEYLRDGELLSKAGETWSVKGLTARRAWEDTSRGRERQQNVVIKNENWLSSVAWESDQSDWVWPSNRFSITLSGRPSSRLMLQDVRISQNDLNKILKRKDPTKGGRPVKRDSWTRFWHAIVQLSQEGRLNRDHFNSQAELRAEVLEMIGDSLSESSIKTHVAQVWKKFLPTSITDER